MNWCKSSAKKNRPNFTSRNQECCKITRLHHCVAQFENSRNAAMAVHWDVNAFDEVSQSDEKKYTSSRMDSRIFFRRHSINFPCRPRPRKPLEGYMHRKSSLQYEPWKRPIFRKVYDPSQICIQPVAQTKYENSSKSKKSSKESSLAESRKNCLLSQIHQARKMFSNLLPISSLPRIIINVIIIGIILGLIFYM